MPMFNAGRYDGWTLDQIIAELRGSTLNLLKRGTLEALIARREWGGLLVAASKLVTHISRADRFVPPSVGPELPGLPDAYEAVGVLAARRKDAV